MKPESVTVSKRGYIVLPASIRREMNIRPGTKVLINKEKGKLTLETIPSFTQKLDGLTSQTIGDTPEAVDAFIDDERKDRTNDDGFEKVRGQGLRILRNEAYTGYTAVTRDDA